MEREKNLTWESFDEITLEEMIEHNSQLHHSLKRCERKILLLQKEQTNLWKKISGFGEDRKDIFTLIKNFYEKPNVILLSYLFR